ncbi:MAG: cysteine rich repeat-containing protein [Betaproteobacteria bacterium]
MEKVEAVRNKRIEWIVTSVVVMGLGLWATTKVFAQGPGPYAEDAAKFCKDVQPGSGSMARCLKEHENELSGACKEHIAQMKQRAGSFTKPARMTL